MRPYSVELLIILSPLLFALLWNEYLSFFYHFLNWSKIRNTDSTKLLLIADPQLLGYHDEPALFGIFTRWDSDRFVSKGFNWAMSLDEPTHIIFLGDLFDEGVKASEHEFDNTLLRFSSIFSKDSLKNKTIIYLSGDNDIGGEGEPVLPHLQRRFSSTFQNNIMLHNNLCFSHIDMLNFEAGAQRYNENNCSTNVLLSHNPVTIFHSHQKVRRVKPDIILSAHDHKAVVHTFTRNGILSTYLTYTSSSYHTKLEKNSKEIEIQVPTCSYRMGTYDTGMSMLELHKNSDGTTDVFLEVLWFPCRFYHLAIYSISLLMVAILFICHRRYPRYIQRTLINYRVV